MVNLRNIQNLLRTDSSLKTVGGDLHIPNETIVLLSDGRVSLKTKANLKQKLYFCHNLTKSRSHFCHGNNTQIAGCFTLFSTMDEKSLQSELFVVFN